MEATRRDVLVRAGLVLASELSLPAILQRMAELACEVADARYGALGVLGPEGWIEEFVTHGVTEDERRSIGHPPVGKGILGVLIKEARPLRLRRIQDDDRSVGFPPNHPPMTSFLGVPVMGRGRVFGNLYLTEKRGATEFTEEDEQAVGVLAAQAAVAIENARLHDELKRLAVLEDRERIARELHDGVIQSLFATGMALQATEATAEDEATRSRLSTAVDDIDRVIRDLRNYIFGLRPGDQVDRQLATALRGLAAEVQERAGIPVDADVDPEMAAVLAGKAGDLIPAAREALSNAVRHSGGTIVTIRLSRDGDAAILEVSDDGRGFDPDEATREGQGLENLRIRAKALEGDLDIDTAKGAGTTVRLRIPVPGR